MSAIKAIYKAEKQFVVDDISSIIHAHIFYNGQWYRGEARLHPEDENFFSEKVGKTIALSRARQQALKEVLHEATVIADIKYQMYQEVTAYGSKAPAEVDPTGAMLLNTQRALLKVQTLKEQLLDEQANLNEYLKDHAKALRVVKRMRSEKAKDN